MYYWEGKRPSVRFWVFWSGSSAVKLTDLGYLLAATAKLVTVVILIVVIIMIVVLVISTSGTSTARCMEWWMW